MIGFALHLPPSSRALLGLVCTALLTAACVQDAGLGDVPGEEGSDGNSDGEITDTDGDPAETDAPATETDGPATDTDGDTDTDGETTLPGTCERIAAEPGDLHDWTLVCGSAARDGVSALAMTPAGDTIAALEIRTLGDDPSPTWELDDGTYEHQGDSDTLLLRFDPQGELVWSRYYGSSSFLNVYALTACGEDVILGGYAREEVPSFGDATLPPGEFLTRFDPEGNVVWSRTFDVQAPNGHVNVRSLSCDDSGNVFVAGTARDGVDFGDGMQPASVSDGFVAKYDPAGALIFARTLHADPSADGFDGVRVAAVVAHTDGSAYVALDHDADVDFGEGPIAPPYPNENALLARISADGTLQWTAPIGGDGLVYAKSLAIDADGRAVVSGLFLSFVDLGGTTYENTFPYEDQEEDLVGTNYDVYVAAFEADGTFAWGLPDGEMRDDDLVLGHFAADRALGVRRGETQLAITEYGPDGAEELLTTDAGFGFAYAASASNAVVVGGSVGAEQSWPAGVTEIHAGLSDTVLVHITR